MIPVYKPFLPKRALQHAHDALDSGWVSKGKYISIVEERLQELLGVKHVLLTNSGTSAAHLVAKGLNEFHFSYSYGRWRLELLAPDNVYVAAWNAIIYDQELLLSTVSTNIDTWNFDLLELEDAKNWGNAIYVIHNLGNIVNVPALKRKYPDSIIIEDNCEGFLGKYEGKYSGTESFASSISFFGNKNITSGEGGALLTNDTDLYEYAKCIHGQGQSNKKFIHDQLGYNYRMTNVQAALILGQLYILDEIIERKAKIFSKYREHFSNREDIRLQKIEKNTEHSNWMFAIRVVGSRGYNYAEKFFEGYGIETRPMFYPITAHKHLANCSDIKYGDIKVATTLNKECIILPSYPELSEKDIKHILDCADKYLGEI